MHTDLGTGYNGCRAFTTGFRVWVATNIDVGLSISLCKWGGRHTCGSSLEWGKVVQRIRDTGWGLLLLSYREISNCEVTMLRISGQGRPVFLDKKSTGARIAFVCVCVCACAARVVCVCVCVCVRLTSAIGRLTSIFFFSFFGGVSPCWWISSKHVSTCKNVKVVAEVISNFGSMWKKDPFSPWGLSQVWRPPNPNVYLTISKNA